MLFDTMAAVSNEEGEELEAEMKRIINRIIEKNSEEAIARFADYRNYMNYEILMTNQVLTRAKLSRQTGYNPVRKYRFRISVDSVFGAFDDLQPACQFHSGWYLSMNHLPRWIRGM